MRLALFNHITREVLDVDASRDFYVNVLGMVEVPRPPLEGEGLWLHGLGLSLHLLQTRVPERRRDVIARRIHHFKTQLPNCDHVAFTTPDLGAVEAVLLGADVFHKKVVTEVVGSTQLFFFDPDGNVIEVTDCSPDVGQTTCHPRSSPSLSSSSHDDEGDLNIATTA